MELLKAKDKEDLLKASSASAAEEPLHTMPDEQPSKNCEGEREALCSTAPPDPGATSLDSSHHSTPPRPSSEAIDSESVPPSQTSALPVKRPKETTPSGATETGDPVGIGEETTKAKKVRKDVDDGGPEESGSTAAGLGEREKESGADIASEGAAPSRPSSVPAPKVPPIKIVLQCHSLPPGEADSMSTASQPHNLTTPNTGFPYIVSSVAEAAAPKDKSRLPDEGQPRLRDEPSSAGECREKTAAPDGLQHLSADAHEASKEGTPSTTLPGTSDERALPPSLSVLPGGNSTTGGAEGSQSPAPSLGGKEKPTRVTRSSQRIATTAHSSPGTSPKNSTCPSPNHCEESVPPPPSTPLQPERETPCEMGQGVSKVKEEGDVHPRKRKLKTKEKEQSSAVSNVSSSSSTSGEGGDTSGQHTSLQPPTEPPHPVLSCFEMYLNIRKQIERRRQGLFAVQPKPPQGFKDYLMNRGTYVLSSTPNAHLAVPSNAPPPALPPPLKDLFHEQERERHRLRLQQVVEKEKLVLSVEQEILRVHGRAARALSNQAVPFSVCTFLKDEEVYNLLTPEQEEKDRNVRSRYNGRLFLSWLQDVDDKWEKIKESMVLRHHNEAESLFAVQKMDWEWKMKEVGLCEPKATPLIDDLSVPMVFVSDDFRFSDR